MKRNIIFIIIFAVLAAAVYLGNRSSENKASESMKKESVKMIENFQPETVTSIKITESGKKEPVKLKKEGDTWKVEDKNCNADMNLVDRILKTVPEIRLGKKIGPWKKDYDEKYGFDKGLSIDVNGKLFAFGGKAGSGTPLKYNDTVYISPFMKRYVFTKYDNNWCEKEEKKEETIKPETDQTTPSVSEKTESSTVLKSVK